MSGDLGEGTPGNIIPLESFRKKAHPPKTRVVARLSVVEDGAGDVDYSMEGVSSLNALALLETLLYMSERLLDIHSG